MSHEPCAMSGANLLGHTPAPNKDYSALAEKTSTDPWVGRGSASVGRYPGAA